MSHSVVEPGLAAGFPHDAPVDPALVGVDATRLAAAVRRFRAMHEAGRYPGGQLVVRRHGHLLIDEVVGVARGADGREPTQPVRATTRFPCFSAGKGVLASLVAILEDRGLLDPKAPIAAVWPEFARHGKGEITALDVLTHRGGVLMDAFVGTPDRWADWAAVVAAVEDAPPSHRRGRIRYHPLEYGWILGELLQRAGGTDLRTLLRREITEPAELAGLTFGAVDDERGGIARPLYLGKKPVRVAGFEVNDRLHELVERPDLGNALVPGAGLVSDAAHLAGFYEVLVAGGVTRGGTRLLRAETLRRYTSTVVTGWDHTNGAPIALGRGFFTGSWLPGLYGLTGTQGCFGHAGLFGVLGFGDGERGLAVGFTTTGHASKLEMADRMGSLSTALRAACD